MHAAYSFSHESNLLLGANGVPQRPGWQRTADKTLPPGALISFLQKGLQYIGIEESLAEEEGNKKQKAKETNNDSSGGLPSDFSLLSQTTVQALTRRNPPIQLIVKPAAAAAAVRARLELGGSVPLGDDHGGVQPTGSNMGEPQDAADEVSSLVSSRPPLESTMMKSDDEGTVGERKEEELSIPNGDVPMETEADDATVDPNQETTVADSERATKKRKTADPDKTENSQQTERTRGFSTLEQARAKLEANKQHKQRGGADAAPAPPPDKRFREVANGTTSLLNGMAGRHPDAMNEDTDSASINGSSVAHSLVIEPGESGEIDEDSNGTEDAASRETAPEDSAVAVRPEEILRLEQHTSEVFMCSWNPIYTNLIATGSGDASARIWEMNEDKTLGLKSSTRLPHSIETGDNKNKDVTTLEWSSNGLLLATGSYDGIARVWDRKGTLIQTLRGHTGPIFSLKWNHKGNFLLSGSYDKTIIVWNVSNIGNHTHGEDREFIERQYKDHGAPALDVDWKNDECFASCSSDRSVHVYDVTRDGPLKVYRGHEDEVNAVKWSPSGKYLASCSDDCTAKVWDTESNLTTPLHDFNDHKQEIYTVKWSPTGAGSANPSKPVCLATASFDGSIRLWNILDGSCLGYLNAHQDSVYSVAFSPSGDFLASGSLAGQLYIWDVVKHQYIKSYRGEGDIFEVSWNKEETRVAACFSSNVVAVVDFDRRKIESVAAPPEAAATGGNGATS